MKKKNVIRAWMDEEYRRSLSESELAMVPEHPAGLPSLTDDEVLGTVTGGCGTFNAACGNSTTFASCEPGGGNTCL